MIPRLIENHVYDRLASFHKVIVLLGARQVGKTTLLLALRPDRGGMWENFLILECIKTYLNQGLSVQGSFWRTYGGVEVDYIEEMGGQANPGF